MSQRCAFCQSLYHKSAECDLALALADRIQKAATAPFAPLAASSERSDPPKDDPLKEVWSMIEHGWDIEDRAYFEREAIPMGFKHPLSMAVHHMWKRRVKEDADPTPHQVNTPLGPVTVNRERLRWERVDGTQDEAARLKLAWMDGAKTAAGYADNVGHLLGNTGGQADAHFEEFYKATSPQSGVGERDGRPQEDVVCQHGTAMDVHCCNCHSGFIFDREHVCPSPNTQQNTGA